MSILVAERLSKSYDPYDIFWDVSASVAHGDRIALVGRNGTGKTTLLRILVGLEAPTEGRVHRARGLTIGYLPQGAALEGQGTLLDEMLVVFEPLRELEARVRELEEQMADPACAEEALEAYAPLRDRFERLGGYTYHDRIKHVLMGLGFSPQEQEMPVGHLSGGQQTRAFLARLLLESPDLLLLDEPTNHLDLQAIEWLEGYLKTWEGTVVLVAHDRYFMDRVVSKVWELAFGRLETYSGNYSHYVQQREARHERLEKEYKAQQQFIAKEEDYIRRYMAGQRTRQAQGRLKRLERLKRDELIDRPREEHTIRLRLQTPLRSGDKVVWSQDLVVGYDPADPLFEAPDLDLRRGECVALLGPNGSGKTTLLKTLLGEVEPLGGYVRLGASLKIGYFRQVHAELRMEETVLDAILAAKDLPLGEARNYLARFLFTGDAVFKRIADLSGGERARVALARLVLERANFLLLDEPTNHLDIASQEVLEEVLDEFTGTILLVTHDRYLVDRLASQLWIVHPETAALEVFEGGWAEYQQLRAGDNGDGPPRESKEKWSEEEREVRRQAQRARREEEARQQRIADLEAEIHALEHQLQALQDEIETATAAQQAMRIHELGTLYAELDTQLQECLEQWGKVAA
ncbi:MAG: ABC-F family ATP-binding cassette domain-containing protein [Anaerolineae bacterium]|nr:ABC-F family ATP-binding cassette domain-containing protein [Anaerolineae bacterium]